MTTTLTLSLAQIDCKLGDPETNFGRAEHMIAEAARRGSDLVLLPELWSTAYALDAAPTLASTIASSPRSDGWFGRVAALSAQHKLYVGGSLLERQGNCYFNCFALYAPDGSLHAAYRKVHLFRLMDEEKYLAPGQELVHCDLPWGRAGLAICYDLRFPELFRHYALAGAQIMLLPAEWPHPRRQHWRTLLRARAIENQCFVAACNRIGTSGAATFFGSSAVIDPWGETLIEGGETEALLTITIDLALVADVRRCIPVFEDRRGELY